MKKTVKILAAVLSLVLVAGCTGKQTSKKAELGEAKYGDTYPIESEVTLTHWMPMNAKISVSASNFGELPVAKELEKRTGIKVEYIHPSLTNAVEKLNLMIASGELPDIISYGWDTYPGGPGKAVSDGVILPLNDYIEAYAPNLNAIHDKYPDLARASLTSEGDFYSAGLFMTDRKLRTSSGIIIREDWLDDLNLSMPETIDEWHSVLTAFKEEKGATAPLSLDLNAVTKGGFIGAFGVIKDFYHIGDTVYFGPMEEGYKEFLKTMNQWYNEGLFDSNFSTNDKATITANMLNGKTGAMDGALSGGLGAMLQAAKDPKFKLAGAPYVTHKKGETPMFGQLVAAKVARSAITTKCKDIELAMKLLDYGYSEEGNMFFNFGTEGVSYEMVDGYPTYTDLIKNNPDGLSMAQAMTKYTMNGDSNNFVQDVRYLEQYAGLPVQQEAWKTWCNTKAEDYVLPTLFIDSEHQTEFATKMTAINSYVDEMYVKFIAGTEPIENFDKYVKNLKELGVMQVLEMKQNAYDEYMKR